MSLYKQFAFVVANLILNTKSHCLFTSFSCSFQWTTDLQSTVVSDGFPGLACLQLCMLFLLCILEPGVESSTSYGQCVL